MTGLLYSQIGYDIGDPMRAVVRSDDRSTFSAQAYFRLEDSAGKPAAEGALVYWGEKWGTHWWTADFSGLNQAGEYTLRILEGEREVLRGEGLRVGNNILWEESVTRVALDQLEERARRARFGNGWLDCGIDWREANSHATMVIGLCDLLNIAHLSLSMADKRRCVAQILRGCDYLGQLQDQAARLGLPAGSLVHEMPNHNLLIPGDQAQAATAWAHASRLLADWEPEKSIEYLRRAEAAFRYVTRSARPFGPENFSASNHGAPPDYKPRDWMTRDLLMMLYAAVELCVAGRTEYRSEAVELAGRVLERQVPRERAEDGLYGHFYAFGDRLFTEKANTHHHVGHDTGSTFPHYIVPLIEMAKRWGEEPEAARWRKAIEDFAYGYFLPACSATPFFLLPEGYFQGEGLLWFCGPWHGINTSYAFAAGLAIELEMYLGDSRFREITTGNLQWIAGLNAGITRAALAGCVKWSADIPEGTALPFSQIVEVGRQWAGGWTGITGTICNGFDANPQFTFTVPPTLANDAPALFTDEDWIPHAAGWISALAKMQVRRVFRV